MVGNISPQAWSVRIPISGADNESKLVRILRGQDSTNIPLLDGVMHEFRSKVKDDILRKGKTKIMVAQEHEEDEEEEEEQEDEEEAWIEEDEVGDEDEAADKGSEVQSNTPQFIHIPQRKIKSIKLWI
ncbi:hypothetical protein GBA52_014766 [Prunus armeniaca]|nr:hypothetical protein GBA52_014766 [Prunus armeniaca]